MNYCHFCEAWFVSGDRCRTEKQRDRCGEYRSIQEAKRLNDSAVALPPSDGETP